MHIPNPLTVEFSVLFAKAAVEHTVGRVASLMSQGGMVGFLAQAVGRAAARLVGEGDAPEEFRNAADVFGVRERKSEKFGVFRPHGHAVQVQRLVP